MINAILPRFFKVAYRKEPISSFILILGAVDAVIGGVGERWSLLSFGIIIILLASLLRWWQGQKAQVALPQKIARQMLPPSSSHSPLPALTNEKKQR